MTTKDKQIWETYTREVKPTSKKKKQNPLPPAGLDAKASRPSRLVREGGVQRAPQLDIIRAPISHNKKEIKPTTLERTREKSLRQGEIEIDAKLDLHGMTQPQAFAALADFMRKKTKAGKRHLLIITGKGPSGVGVLRQNLKPWLEQLPEANSILALRPAAPKHGGSGAFYVLLRKK